MKWIAISGSWRITTDEIEQLVREDVAAFMQAGHGLVSGGVVGVDLIALETALVCDATAERIKIFLPTTLELFSRHMRNRVAENIVSGRETERLIDKLEELKRINGSALIEGDASIPITQAGYYERNSRIVENADEIHSYRVVSELSQGLGTDDAVQKARSKGKPVKERTFSVDVDDPDVHNWTK